MFELERPILRTYLFISLSFVGFILHNFYFAIFRAEEPVLFILTLVFFLAFLLSLILNLANHFIEKKPQDIYKLGGLGFFGLLGWAFNFTELYWFFALLILFLFRTRRGRGQTGEVQKRNSSQATDDN